jgi:hypothetical protein
MKKYLWIIMSFILLIILVVQIRTLVPLEQQITYIYDEREKMPSLSRAYELLEEDRDFGMLWWTMEGKGKISCPGLSAEVSCPAVAMAGDTDIWIEGANSDSKCCVLGCETASRLFGDENVAGLKVSFYGKEYTVRSVSESIKELFAYTKESGGDGTFNRLTLAFDNPASKGFIRSRAETLYGPDNLLDHDLICFLLEIVAAALIILFAVLICKTVSENRKWDIFLKCAVWASAVLVVIWIIKVPVDFIPGRWSDFTFWKELIWDKEEALNTFISTELSPMDMIWVRKYFAITALEVLSAFSLVLFGVGKREG